MEKLELIQKAFIVWHKGMLDENPYEGYRIEDIPVTYADTAYEAIKNATLPYDYELYGQTPKRSDLKVRRAPGGDKVMCFGNITTRVNATLAFKKEELTKSRRFKIEQYPDNTMFYVQNGYVGNAVLWWGLNSCGYVTDINHAQIYTKKEILDRFVDGREEDRIWEASHVLSNIKQVVDCQKLNYKFVA